MSRNWEENFHEDMKLLNEIVEQYENLAENDIKGAYIIQRMAIQAYERFSEVKYKITCNLLRGEQSSLKKRLDEITTYLYSVHVACRKVYEKAAGDLKYYKED